MPFRVIVWLRSLLIFQPLMDANSIPQILTVLARKWTWLPMVMGLARLGCKFWNAILQAKLTAMMVAAATGPDQKEIFIWENVLGWTPYRVVAFGLDLVLSVKLPTLTDFLHARDQALTEGHQQGILPQSIPAPAQTNTQEQKSS